MLNRIEKRGQRVAKQRQGRKVKLREGEKIFAVQWHLRVLPTGGTCHRPTCLYPYKNNWATKNRLDITAVTSCERTDWEKLSQSFKMGVLRCNFMTFCWNCQHADTSICLCWKIITAPGHMMSSTGMIESLCQCPKVTDETNWSCTNSVFTQKPSLLICGVHWRRLHQINLFNLFFIFYKWINISSIIYFWFTSLNPSFKIFVIYQFKFLRWKYDFDTWKKKNVNAGIRNNYIIKMFTLKSAIWQS